MDHMNVAAWRPALAGRRTSTRLRWVGLVALVLVLVAVPPASASEEGESEFALDLVQQAIAFIANDGGADRALEKMEDALGAPDPSGVDLALVEAAAALVEDAAPGPAQDVALTEARALLLQAAPALSEPPTVEMARGLATGTTVVLNPFEPARGISDGGDAALLAMGFVSILVGLWLSRRTRPHHSIRQLRHMDVPGPRAAPTQEAKP